MAGVALFVYFFRLGVPSFRADEITYREAGVLLWSGDFSGNVENTPLAQYVLGAARELFGDGPLAVRVPTAAAGLLTGLFLGLLAHRVGGWPAAALAFALWCLLPRPSIVGAVDIEQIKIERYARLDVYMGMFVAASLFAGWRWAETGRWRWAVAAGSAVGLAAASKAPGVLVLPAILGCGLLALGLSRRVLIQALGVVAVALVALAATYLPAGTEAPSVISEMLDTQQAHAKQGHPFVFDGEHYQRAPWWGNVWWQWKSLGTPATLAIGICALLAPFVLRRALAVLLLGTTLVIGAFFTFGIDYGLPHYYYAWQPSLMLTAALVLYELIGRGTVARVAAAALAIPLVLLAAGTVWDVGRIEPRDYRALERELGDRLQAGTVASSNLPDFLANLPDSQASTDPYGLDHLAAVVDDSTFSSRVPTPQVTAFVDEYRSLLRLRRIDFLNVYLPRSSAAAVEIARRSRARQYRTPAGRRAAALQRCLVRAGLAGRMTLHSGTSATVEVQMANGSAAFVAVEPSEAAAIRSAKAIAAFIRESGAAVEREGRVVYQGQPRPADAAEIESCAGNRAEQSGQ